MAAEKKRGDKGKDILKNTKLTLCEESGSMRQGGELKNVEKEKEMLGIFV